MELELSFQMSTFRTHRGAVPTAATRATSTAPATATESAIAGTMAPRLILSQRGKWQRAGGGEGGRQSQRSQTETGKACVAQVEEGGVGIASVVARTDVPAPALPEVHGGLGTGGRAGALRGRLLLLLGARDGTVARGVGHRFRSFVVALLILAVRALQLLRDLGEECVRRGEAEQLCANKKG